MRSFLVLVTLVLAAISVLAFAPSASHSADDAGSSASKAKPSTREEPSLSPNENQSVLYLAGDHDCSRERLAELGGQLNLGPSIDQKFAEEMREVVLRAREEGRGPTDAEVEAAFRPYMEILIAQVMEEIGDCLRELAPDG